MGKSRVIVICVLAAAIVCMAALPAAAATIRIVNGRVVSIEQDSDSARCTTGWTSDGQYLRVCYRLPSGKLVCSQYRISLPGNRAPVPEPKPAPEPEPEPAPEPEPTPDPEPAPSALTAEEKQMFDLVNKERVAAGLRPLEIDMRLVEQARLKSQDMSRLGYFSHQSPTYGSPFDQMKKAGITYRAAGENLAGAPTVAMAHNGLMNSPGHRANILNSAYTHVGIGVAKSSKYGLLFTQMFIAK